tara:strand:+ start:663 stop:1091 length:429 start_codon:yes stop_codon:yes gene_type:complete
MIDGITSQEGRENQPPTTRLVFFTKSNLFLLNHFCSPFPKQLAVPAFALPAAWRLYGAGFLDKTEVTDRVVAVVKNFNKVDPGKVGPTSVFAADLGLDSLDTVEVVMAMEEEFAVEIPDTEADKITSVAEAVAYLVANPDAK